MDDIAALRFGTEVREPHWWTQQRHVPPLLRRAYRLLADAAHTRQGAHWRRVFTHLLPIHRVDVEGAQQAARGRQIRHDHLQNVLGVLVACITSADWSREKRPALIARPVTEANGRTEWERPGWDRVGEVAYGPEIPGERSARRTERAVRELIAAGLLQSTAVRQFEGLDAAGIAQWRSKTSLKLVSTKVWRVLGLWGAYKQHLRMRQAAAGIAQRERLARVAGIHTTQAQRRRAADDGRPSRPRPAGTVDPPRPPSTAGPWRPERVSDPATASEHIDTISAVLGLVSPRR